MRRWSFLPLAAEAGPANRQGMTFFIAFGILALAAAALLVVAGRESLRVNGFPTRPIRRLEDLFHLMELGLEHLNRSSAGATRRRMNGSY